MRNLVVRGRHAIGTKPQKMRGLRHVHGETNPVQIMASALDLVDRQIRILRQSGFGRTVMVALFREKVWRGRMGV